MHGTAGALRTPQLKIVVAAILVLAAATATSPALTAIAAPVAAFAAILAVGHERLLSWHSMVIVLLALILFVPIRQYGFRMNLPFQMEPYRVYVLLLAGLWTASLLVDPRVRIRRSGLERPLALLAVGVLFSVLFNLQTIAEDDLATEVTKKLTFWLSFVLVFYFVASTVRVEQVDTIVRTIVLGGVVLAAFAVYEARTGTNYFTRLDRLIPILEPVTGPLDTFRAGMNRAYGSAQHPIAFGAAMALIVPFSVVYAYRRRSVLWMGAVAFVLMGALASISRTSTVMIVVSAAVLAMLRPTDARKLVPYLLPLAVAIQIVMPGTLSTMKAQFFPSEGLVAEQANQQVGSGRVASLGPALDRASERPLFGRGFGTRIVDEGPKQNSFILDNEWLSTLDELGLVGIVAWGWLLLRFCRRTGAASRHGDSDESWLMAAFCASVASFAAGMAFFDAFSFIQATVLMLILLALGSVLLRDGAWSRATVRRATAAGDARP